MTQVTHLHTPSSSAAAHAPSTLFDLRQATVLVVGAGIMGAGIAQVAALAGHAVLLFDARDGAADQARTQLATTLNGLAAKGKMTADVAAQALARIQAITDLASASGAHLVVEAIVEKLEVKRGLFKQLEDVVAADCVLATNTSSISVTAIANGLRHPQRLVGMHFFNPVPLMKLVEVVSGLQTAPAVAEAIFQLSGTWGKTAVHARSTPGFIVNRIARPYYAETLALLQTQAASPAELDACLRAVGFRMGPCELMDLIGHDTNFSVTQSVYEANFYDKRFVPSLVQRELVDGGLLGRKSGQGFYSYGADGKPVTSAGATPLKAASPATDAQQPAASGLPTHQRVTVCGTGPVAERLNAAITAAFAAMAAAQPSTMGAAVAHDTTTDWVGLDVDGAQLRLTDGRTATAVAASLRAAAPGRGRPAVAVFDLPLFTANGGALAWAADVHPDTRAHADGASLAECPTEADTDVTTEACSSGSANSATWAEDAPRWLAALGFAPQRLADAPGLVVARTLAMLINEAADAVHQGVCSATGADAAMKLGVNYPAGPFEWLARWDVRAVVALLDALDAHERGERYRVSPWLRQASGA
jgi:3-hydroxybutyryl-CoA dehydrogenase